jgi:hypothetical protein
MGKGMEGKEYLLMNVISRADYKWHQENKHTTLLSKNVNIVKRDDGKINIFAEPGVPAYGFVQGLSAGILKPYGFWENYDIGLTRTGNTTPPMMMFNATKNPEMVYDKDIQALISSHVGLTEEEASWEQYDLDKLFHVTSATKFLTNFKDFLQIVDANLGSSFLKDITALSEAEKLKWAEEKVEGESEEEDDEEEEPVPTPVQSSAPVAATVIEGERPIVDVKFQLPGWSKLSDSDKSLIDSATKLEEGWAIKYKEGTKARSLCIKCDTKIPASFTTCPACGENQDADDIPF